MSKPFICGDEPAVFVPGEACECNYSMKKLDATEFYDPRYSLTLDGSSVGTPIEVPTLANYYNKTEVDALLNAIDTGQFIVVQSLPAEGQDKAIYLVPHTGSTPDAYDEYIWVNDAWELIGTTAVDLSNYYTKTEVDSALCAQYPVGSVYITSTNSNPSAYLCGTWELFDKEFQYQVLDTGITWNDTNVKTADRYVRIHREGHRCTIRLMWTSNAWYADTDIEIGTLTNAALGLAGVPYASYLTAWTDAGNAVGLLNITPNTTDNTVYMRDVVPNGTAVSVGPDNPWFLQGDILAGYDGMLDSACDKFYWKRTA